MKIHMLHSNSFYILTQLHSNFDYVTKDEVERKSSQEKYIPDELIKGFNDLFCETTMRNFINHQLAVAFFHIH